MNKLIIPITIKENKAKLNVEELKDEKIILDIQNENFSPFNIETQENVLKQTEQKNIYGIRITLNSNDVKKQSIKELKKYKLKEVNLLVESTNDYILRNIGSNYDFSKIKKASKIIKHNFIKMNIITVIGLPEATLADDLNTIKQISKLKPKEIIIIACDENYNNKVKELYASNEYEPLSAIQITERLKEVISVAEKAGIKNIKIEEKNNIKNNVLESIWYDRIVEKIKSYNVKVKEVKIEANPKDIENIKGIKDANLIKLNDTYDVEIKLEENEKIKEGQLKMQILKTYTDFLEEK